MIDVTIGREIAVPADVQARVRFDREDAERAYQEWGANCGPGALAAVLGLPLDNVRRHLIGFEEKRYTNPTMMAGAIRSLGRAYFEIGAGWPKLGLVRVQWEGPWTAPGVPMRVRYRHTHWVGSYRDSLWKKGDTGPAQRVERIAVFDINAICVGGWLPYAEWAEQLVPWLVKRCEPKSNGRWHTTHRWQMNIKPDPYREDVEAQIRAQLPEGT